MKCTLACILRHFGNQMSEVSAALMMLEIAELLLSRLACLWAVYARWIIWFRYASHRLS